MEPTHPAAPACLCLLPAEGGISEMKYRFYVTRQGAPLRLWMMGTNLYSGGCEGGGAGLCLPAVVPTLAAVGGRGWYLFVGCVCVWGGGTNLYSGGCGLQASTLVLP